MKYIYILFLLLLISVNNQAQTVLAGWKLNSDSIQCLSNNSFFGDDTSVVTSGIYNKTWYYGDGDSCHCLHANHSYTKPGIYEIKLLIESNGVYDSMIHQVTVLPSAKPYYKVNSFVVCRGEYFEFTDTVTNNYGASRIWKFGDGYTDTNKVVKHIYTKSDLFYPVLLYNYTNSCIDSNDSYTLEIMPNIVSHILANTKKVCENSTQVAFDNISDVDTGITGRYKWSSIQSSASDTENVYKFNPNMSGKYNIYLNVESSNGCVSADSVILVVDKQPSISWTWAPSVICKGDTIALSTFGSLPPGMYDSIYYTYLYNHSLLKVDTSAILLNVYDSGIYQVMSHNGTCLDSTGEHSINLVIPTKSSIAKIGDTLWANKGSNYNWFKNGIFISGANLQFYIPVVTGKYTVLVSDSNQCGLMSDTQTVYTGINELTYKTWRVYPNPTNSVLNIECQLNTPAEYNIYDLSGKSILQGNFIDHVQVNLQDLHSNIYVLRIILSDKVYYNKFIKN